MRSLIVSSTLSRSSGSKPAFTFSTSLLDRIEKSVFGAVADSLIAIARLRAICSVSIRENCSITSTGTGMRSEPPCCAAFSKAAIDSLRRVASLPLGGHHIQPRFTALEHVEHYEKSANQKNR